MPKGVLCARRHLQGRDGRALARTWPSCTPTRSGEPPRPVWLQGADAPSLMHAPPNGPRSSTSAWRHHRLPRQCPPSRAGRRLADDRAREGRPRDAGRRRNARPLLDELATTTRHLFVARLRKRRRTAHCGDARAAALVAAQRAHHDAAGSSETGAKCSRPPRARRCRWPLHAGPDTLVVDETLRHILEPGHPGIGWLAQAGVSPRLPERPVKTAATFPVIDGRRYSIPVTGPALPTADRAARTRLVTINSEARRSSPRRSKVRSPAPGVVDVVVAGRQSERWARSRGHRGGERSAPSRPRRSSSMPVRRSPLQAPKAVVFVPPSSGRPRQSGLPMGQGRARRMAEVSRASGRAPRSWRCAAAGERPRPFAELNADPRPWSSSRPPHSRRERRPCSADRGDH